MLEKFSTAKQCQIIDNFDAFAATILWLHNVYHLKIVLNLTKFGSNLKESFETPNFLGVGVRAVKGGEI